jgi:hypothetical protein
LWQQKRSQFDAYITKTLGQVLELNNSMEALLDDLQATVIKHRALASEDGRISAANLVTHLSIMNSSISITQEQARWAELLRSFLEQSTVIEKFDPKAFYLSRHVAPFRPHVLLRPSPFDNPSSAFQLYADHCQFPIQKSNEITYMALFEKQYGPKLWISNCLIFDVPSIAFLLRDSLAILLLAQSNEDIEFLDWTVIPPTVIEAIFTDQFGPTTIFFHHIVLRITISSILFACSVGQFNAQIWSLTSGQLLIGFARSEFSKFVQRWNSQSSLLPFRNLTTITTWVSAVSLWNFGQLANDELLYLSNAFDERSFGDPVRPCIFPREDVTGCCSWSRQTVAEFIGERDETEGLIMYVRSALRLDSFASCAFCPEKAACVCVVCQRAFCKRCRPTENLCGVCSTDSFVWNSSENEQNL